MSKLKRFANVVEHAGTGLRLPEETARTIDRLTVSKDAAFAYRRMAVEPTDVKLLDGERCDVSVVSTHAPDRDGDVVLAGGLDLKHFNNVVPFAHKYDELPVGRSLWCKVTPDGSGLLAKTHYPEKPQDWGEAAPWMPSAVLHLMRQGVCTGKSIGYLPLEVRLPTGAEKQLHPDWDGCPVTARGAMIEYSVVPIPCQAEAETIAVSKALRDGVIDRAVAELLVAPDAAPAHVQVDLKLCRFLMALPPEEVAALKAMAARVDADCRLDPGAVEDFRVRLLSWSDTQKPGDALDVLLDKLPAARLRLGKTIVLESADKQSEVLALAIDSPDLHRLHAQIKAAAPPAPGPAAPTDDEPFAPHVVLARLKPGTGAKYAGMDDVDGRSIKSTLAAQVDVRGHETRIELTNPAAAAAAPAAKTVQNPATPACPTCKANDGVAAINDYLDGDGDLYHCANCDDDFEAQAPPPAPAAAAAPPADALRTYKNFRDMAVNPACLGRVKRLIAEGLVDLTPPAPAAAKENAVVASDVECLALDTSIAKDAPAAEIGNRFKSPVIVDGRVCVHALNACAVYAKAQGAAAVAAAAESLHALAVKHGGKSLLDAPVMRPGDFAAAIRLEADRIQKQLIDQAHQAMADVLTLSTGK